MEYSPRYPQPFTISQAVGLDVGMITEEIARLQNSLAYLRSTQAQLKEVNDESPDPEFTKAMEENDDVIGSQEERISMLKIALTEKGIPMDGHYAVDFDRHLQPPAPVSATPVPTPPLGVLSNRASNTASSESRQTEAHPPPSTNDSNFHMDEDGGIDL